MESSQQVLHWRERAPAFLSVAGLLWTLVATLDPARPSGAWGGPTLCLLAVLRRGTGRRHRALTVAATVAIALAISVAAHPEFRRGEFRTYFAYLRSMAFDHDLDFANEYEAWGWANHPLTPTGHRWNILSIGPAIAWSPFFAAAHAYVLLDDALAGGRYTPDGYSVPYIRSALAGTVTVAVLGSWLLLLVMERRLERRLALLAILAAIATSPLLVYIFAEPGVSHGLTYGLACAGVWALDRAHRRPSVGAWALLGAVCGFIVLLRFQAAALAAVAIPLAVVGLARRTVRPTWLLAAGASAFLAVSPQLMAWKVIYGHWFTTGADLREWSAQTGLTADVIFRPERLLDFSSPFLAEVFLSADRGLFTWSPGLFLALCGLVLGIRRWGFVGVGGLLVLATTAWYNGSWIRWWSGGDAYGARRFDLVIPFLAMGYGSLLALLVRVPLLAPTVLLAGLTLWNVGLASLWRSAIVPEAAALDELASLQAHELRHVTERALGGLFGDGGRALAYDFFVGRFFFVNTTPDGAIDVGSPTASFLTGQWSTPINESGPPSFRLAFPPRACARIPLLRPVDLAVRITAKAAGRRESLMKVTLNGVGLGQALLGEAWGESVVPLPSSSQVAGENLLCLEFDADAAKRPAARVRRIVVH